MADELAQIKAQLASLADRVSKLETEAIVRLDSDLAALRTNIAIGLDTVRVDIDKVISVMETDPDGLPRN